MTGDIVFLLIFVILPTALIVSGIWLILFIRKEPEARTVERRKPAQLTTVTETEKVAAIQTDRELEIAPLPASAAAGDVLEAAVAGTSDEEETFNEPDREREPVSDHDAVEELSPLAADLLYDDTVHSDETVVDDSRLMELLEPADRELLEEQIVDEDPEQDVRVEQTEEIPGVEPAAPVADEPVEATRDLSEVRVEDENEEWRPRPAGDDRQATDDEVAHREDDRALQRSADDATPLTGSDGEAVEDDESDDGNGERQRQPGVRLLPTGEAERKRGRASGRRVPPIGRLNRRDESSVESGDSPPDVSSGYGK